MVPDVILGGEAEVAIGQSLIPARYLGDISPNFEEGTRESTTLGGTRTTPSGMLETSELTFTLYLPSMDFLKNIWEDIYNEPSAPQLTGNFVLGGGSCVMRTPKPVNIHYTCDENSNNDVHIFAGIVAFNFNPTYNDSDGLSVEVTIYAQPTEDGTVQIGTGDLTEPVLWDHETEDWVPVAS